MSEISKLIAEIKSAGILRAGNKLEQLYGLAEQMETDHAALQQKLDALAAENAALKTAISTYAKVKQDFDDFDGDRRGIAESLCEAEDALVSGIKTPATDPYLNSVRADSVEDAAKRLFGQGYTFEVLRRFAAKLRSGTHDTADKAG